MAKVHNELASLEESTQQSVLTQTPELLRSAAEVSLLSLLELDLSTGSCEVSTSSSTLSLKAIPVSIDSARSKEQHSTGKVGVVEPPKIVIFSSESSTLPRCDGDVIPVCYLSPKKSVNTTIKFKVNDRPHVAKFSYKKTRHTDDFADYKTVKNILETYLEKDGVTKNTVVTITVPCKPPCSEYTQPMTLTFSDELMIAASNLIYHMSHGQGSIHIIGVDFSTDESCLT